MSEGEAMSSRFNVHSDPIPEPHALPRRLLTAPSCNSRF